ncbi:MAG: hypothetical protein IJM37_06125 [Lachnospiraceae bacterium]|nr:hypothetical protein [Lachnospiraceae bacterium]
MNETNKLTDWVIKKIKKEYKDDVALLLAVHGHNTADDLHGIVFDYFVPATERGNELAETFIIDGVGHDLYPRTWERLEASASLSDMAIVLDGAEILYARSDDDRERFMELKRCLHENLNNPEFVYGKALEYMDKALEIYRTLIFEDRLYRVRSEAGCIHYYLTKAVAVMNHSYAEEPIFSKEQADNDDPDSRMYHCPKMQQVPDGFYENANILMTAKEPEQIKEAVLLLLKATREFILEREPKKDTGVLDETDYRNMADWYQELSLTWRRIRYYCTNNMVEPAYCDALYLQEELLYAAQEYHIEEMNLLDFFDAENLLKLRERADALENRILEILAGHNTPVNSYESIEAFLKVRG